MQKELICFVPLIMIGILFAAIILYFFSTVKKLPKINLSYSQFCIERKDNQKKIQQKFDDEQLIRDAKAEALDMFQQWVNGNIMIIHKPIIKFIICHYPYTSKYTSEDLNKIRTEEFTKLINEYKSQNILFKRPYQ